MTAAKRRALIAVGTLALCAVALLALWLAGALAPAWSVPEPSAQLLAAGDALDRIEIDATYAPEGREVNVVQRMTLTNRTGAALNSAVFRTWVNAFQSSELSPAASEELFDLCYPDGFSSGALQMNAATVAMANGAAESAQYRYLDDAKTVLSLPLGKPWESGETITAELRYKIIVPRARYRFAVNNGVCVLGNAFAIPAVYENGAWRTDEYAPVGDPFVSDCANYAVTMRVPEGMTCMGGGVPEVSQEGGEAVYRFQALAVRDFALVLGEGFTEARGMQNGVALLAYAQSGDKARELLGYMRQAIACYGERYGAYLYPSYACVALDFPLGGMEYPMLSLISSGLSSQSGTTMEYVVAHETAHQWWYAAVGSDSVNQPWQDEALCEFSTLEYYESTHGRAARDELEQTKVEYAMRATVAGSVSPGAPVTYFESMSQYSLVVYDRGTALFCALDKLLNGKLDAALSQYYRKYAFARATRQDFETLVYDATGEDVAPLMLDYLDTKLAN